MNECTKGKLETDQSCVNCIDILSKEDGSIVAQIMECEEDELSVIQRTNAKELVRRWNAFEEGGLVEKLRTTCEKLIKANEYARKISLRDESPRGIVWGDTRSHLDEAKLKAKIIINKIKKAKTE